MNVFKCDMCNKQLINKRSLANHKQKYHLNYEEKFPCGFCSLFFSDASALDTHRKEKHASNNDFREKESALRNTCQVHRLTLEENIESVNKMISYASDQLINLLETKIQELNSFKFALILGAEYEKFEHDLASPPERLLMNFRSSYETLTQFSELTSSIARALVAIESNSEEFTANGSGWMLHRLLYLDVEIGQCYILSGSCSIHKLNLTRNSDKILGVHKDDINSRNDSEEGYCFFYAIASFFCDSDANVDELSEFIVNNIIINIRIPVRVSDVEKFEKQNSHLQCSINIIYKNADGSVFPVYISKIAGKTSRVNLLLFHTSSQDSTVNASAHYVLIDDLSKVIAKARKEHSIIQVNELITRKTDIREELSSWTNDPVKFQQLTEELELLEIEKEELDQEVKKQQRKDRVHVCYNCFSVFSTNIARLNHEKWCFKSEPTTILLAHPTEKDEFELKRKHVKAPILFFFDFEALQIAPEKTCKCPNNTVTCTHATKVQYEHEPFAYCITVIRNNHPSHNQSVLDVIDYVGEHAISHFLNDILDLEEKYMPFIEANTPIAMSDEEERAFQKAKRCYICKKPFLEHDKKVRDHEHSTGQYLGAAHNSCNLQRRDSDMQIPVFCHNLISYDGHFIMKNLHIVLDRILFLNAIPLNTEKFKQIHINNLIFKDSMSFMDGSLERLVDTLLKSKHEFKLLNEVFTSKTRQNLMLRKGVYPYEFAKDISVLQNATCLPSHEDFYSSLSNAHISKADYEHALKVWEVFECHNMIDYTRIYVLSDCILLAEVIQSFRRTVFRDYELDPVHFVSLPSLSKDIMLKVSGIRLDLISDPDIVYFFKNNIRGGLSFVSNRYFNAEDYERRTGTKHSMIYVDANSLYGAAMSHKLPIGDYSWLSEQEIEDFDFKSLSFESEIGYAFEVTLSYPEELHILHNSYPLAAEHIEIKPADLSQYAKQCLEEIKLNYRGSKKLGATFRKRERYVCHGMNLKLYLELGLKLEKIHSAVKFAQGDYMKNFVDQMAEKRRKAVTEMDSMIAKRIVNSVFGKVSSL